MDNTQDTMLDMGLLREVTGVDFDTEGYADRCNDEALSVLRAWQKDPHGDPELPWDLLSSYGRLKRMDPGLRSEDVLQQLEGLVLDNRETLLEWARSNVLDIGKWIDAAVEYDTQGADENPDEAAVIELLEDLDDVTLIQWALDRLEEGAGDAFCPDVERAFVFIGDDAGLFFAGWKHAATMRTTFDTTSTDAFLLVTQDNFLVLLDAFLETCLTVG